MLIDQNLTLGGSQKVLSSGQVKERVKSLSLKVLLENGDENKNVDLEDIKDNIKFIDEVYHFCKDQVLPLLVDSIYNEFWQKLA